jgi:glycosyltransferase involved in cell wall biosynthesis
MKPNITAVILARNEAAMIEGCIRTLSWCREILVIDDSSSDETAQKAEALGARVVKFSHPSFARKRNEALKHAKGEWLFYIDADERVTPTLAKEILVHIETGAAPVLKIRRENYAYGHFFQYGGWQHDWVTPVFQKEALREWTGDIHESPVYEGETAELHSPLLHLTHRSTEENLRKSADWTKIEAELLYKAGEKPVRFITLLRKGTLEFFRRAVQQKGYRDGLAGLIEALVQGINRIFVYIQVWEFQQKPDLPERYQKKEQEIQALWKQEKGL